MAEWRRIYNAARVFCPEYIHSAMLLVLVIGQRRGYIVRLHRLLIWDDHLHIVQQKTGAQIALPLALRCEALDLSLHELLEQCPGDGLFINDTTIGPWNLTHWFAYARDIAFSRASWLGAPPKFHEQRSLAERLYRVQGVDTKTLLGHGHKSMSQTDRYNDDRGRECRRFIL
ncbi:tyrosine-type recombinase/integrase [Pantoea sp. ACRSH]|uniref:tyrosine-type recombinase/integrase n=1 Tax=unclassified Pantoea TaxID=2630326 RepID=UPI001EF64F98|nr:MULTISPECIES: tyrosine-type recombinase/integrase [unclassified Pantoea]MCG7367732.1 tyrosine-type recombinase/integrase [Pantoea sp. ACRSH]MCG7398164.1 tyrosine-type recombinase/integrase [Pantoea sp. ACRSC]